MKGIAFAAKVGLSQGYISEIENGKRRLTEEVARRVAKAFGISVSEFEEELELAASPTTGQWEIPTAALTVAEEPGIYRAKARDPTEMPVPNPHESLARFFVDSMPREKAFALVRELTDQAEHGDLLAASRAQALLYILTTP